MDLKTRIEVLPCGKCEDMIDCDNCLFQKEAKELYEQIRADLIREVEKKVRAEVIEKHFAKIMSFINTSNRGNSDYFIVDQIENYITEQLKEQK